MASWRSLLSLSASSLNAQLLGPSHRKISSISTLLVDRSESEMVHHLNQAYLYQIRPILIQEFNYKNIDQIPKVEKIVVNCGIGDAAESGKGLQAALNDLGLLTGQRAGVSKDIATFRNREDQPHGVFVTLRNKVMYSFLERLVNMALPRTMDSEGVTNSFDGKGNYRIGFREQNVFPELSSHILNKLQGIYINISTTAETDLEAQRLLALMGVPFGEKGGGGVPKLLKKKKPKPYKYDPKSKTKPRK